MHCLKISLKLACPNKVDFNRSLLITIKTMQSGSLSSFGEKNEPGFFFTPKGPCSNLSHENIKDD